MGEYLSSPEGKHIFLNGAHTQKNSNHKENLLYRTILKLGISFHQNTI